MHQVQTALAGIDGVRLVSFTVDPARDTPAVLAAYASHFEARPGIWYLSHRPKDALHHTEPRRFHAGRRRRQPGTFHALRAGRPAVANPRLLSHLGSGRDSAMIADAKGLLRERN